MFALTGTTNINECQIITKQNSMSGTQANSMVVDENAQTRTFTDTYFKVSGGGGVDVTAGGPVKVLGTSGNTLYYSNYTSNGSVATTLGSVGPTGSTAGNPTGWITVSIGGTNHYVPFW